MSVTINAIGIIAVLVLTVLLLIKWGEKPKSGKPIMAGICCSLALALISITVSFHACHNGQPFLQWLLPSLSLGLFVIFIKGKWKLILLISIMIISSMLLSLQYAALVHTDRYIGVPDLKRPVDDGNNEEKKIDTFSLWHTSFSGIYGIRQAKDKHLDK